MKGRRITRRSVVAFAAVLFALSISGGAAYGSFTSTGSGHGSGSTGSMAVVTIAAISGETPATALQPGSTGEVIVKVTNPNTYPVHVVSVVAAGAVTVTGGSGCTLANSGVAFTDQTGLSVLISASATLLVRLPGVVAMSTASVSGCQGATFNIPVTVTAHTP
jgi:hypothetical protein